MLLFGRVVDLQLKTAVVEDLRTKERFTCKLDGDEAFEVKVGDEGTFAGRVRNGEYVVRRVDVRKFLDPLYEEDMLKTAGLTSLVAPIDDPFPEMYMRFKAIEEQRRAEEEKANEEKAAQEEAEAAAEQPLPSTDYEEEEGSHE